MDIGAKYVHTNIIALEQAFQARTGAEFGHIAFSVDDAAAGRR